MPAELQSSAFQKHLNDTFTIQTDGVEGLALQLIQVKKLGESDTKKMPGGRRHPFSLLFRGPAELHLSQATYRIAHPVMGELAIFIVPVGPDREGMQFEAIFA